MNKLRIKLINALVDELQAKAAYLQFSEDLRVVKHIETGEILLSDLPNDLIALENEYQQMPRNVQDEFYLFPEYLSYAKAHFDRREKADLAEMLVRILENRPRMLHDKWVLGLQRQFGKDAEGRRQQVKEKDEPRWQAWREMAQSIIKNRPDLADSTDGTKIGRGKKTDVARIIKSRLGAPDSVDTIRKRI